MVVSAKTIVGIIVEDSELFYTTEEENQEDIDNPIIHYFNLYNQEIFPDPPPPRFGFDLRYGLLDLIRNVPGDTEQVLGKFTSQMKDFNARADLNFETLELTKNYIQEKITEIGLGDREIKIFTFLYVDNLI